MMSRMDAVNATTEELVNSITITQGPVQNMSLGIAKNTRTPYSDATKVRSKSSIWTYDCSRKDLSLQLGIRLKESL